MRPRARRLSAGSLVAFVVVTAGVFGGSPNEAAGQSDGAASRPDEPLEIVVEQTTPWVGVEGDYAVKLRVPPTSSGWITASIYEPLITVSEVAITATGRGLGRREYRLPAQPWGPGATSVVVRIPVTTVERDDGRIRLDAAVYSVVLDIEPDTGAEQRLVTHLRHLAEQPLARSASIIAPLEAPLSVTNGRLRVSTAAAAEQLGADLASLAEPASAPVTLSLSPALLANDDPAAVSTAVAALRRSTTTNAVLQAPYAPLDPQGWLDAGLAAGLADQFEAGADALRTLSGRAARDDIWLAGPTASLSLVSWLAERGVSRFVLPPAGALREGEPLRIAGLAANHIALRAVDTSPAPGDHGALAADRILTRLAIDALDDSATAWPLVIVLSAEQVADRRQTAVLLDALRGGGAVQARPLVEAFEQAEQAPPGGATAELAPAAAPPPVDIGANLARLAGGIDSFAAAVGADHPSLASLRLGVLAAGAASLSQADRSAIDDTIVAVIAEGLAGVDMPVNAPITITSHTAEVPLTIRNRSDRALSVRVEITSSELEVRGENPRLLVLEAGQTTDLEVDVRVGRSGDFSLDVRVATPDGALTIAGPTTVTLRSNAISGLGLVISVGALCFLVLWWVRQVRSKARAAATAPADHETATQPTDESRLV